jgi:ABC-2 type transport system permease protein
MNIRLANIFRLGIKELRSLRADPVLIALILYTFTYAVYSVTKDVSFEVLDASVAIVDEDHSELSRRLAAAIMEPYFRPPVLIGPDDVEPAMNNDRYVFVIDIPPRFEEDVLAGRRPSIQINVDATAMTLAGNGAVYLQNILTQEVLVFQRGREGAAAMPINLVMRARFNPNGDSEWFMSVMQVVNNITILSIILSGAALIREREHGTIEHLLVMPVTSFEIMLAKIWANGLVIAVAAILSLWFVVRWFLGVPIAGSIALFVAGTLLYQFSVTALGILLATFASSMPQFGLLAIPVIVIMDLLSGSTTPMESMPSWLQTVMQIAPSTHFIRFSQAVLYRGAGFDIVWIDLLVLSAIGLAFFLVSLARFRRAIIRFR